MMLCKRIVVLCLSTLLFLTGCNSPVYNQTEANVADVSLRNQAAKAHMAEVTKPEPTLVINQGLYVDKTPINFARNPGWLQNRIVLRGEQLPFSYYNRTILEGGSRNILTHYQTGLNDKTMLSMNYSGPVKGALDLLAARTGYVYSVSGNNIYWQAYVTRTFDIAFMPGSSDYLMGKASGGATSGGAAGSAAPGSGSGGAVSGTIDDSSSSQYSNLKATLSVWKDLETSIKQLLSPEGKVMVSEATTSVTVRDHPTNVNLISRFINNVNNNLSRQVLVKVDILTVTLENDFNFGINWNVVQHAIGNGNYQLVSNNGAPISITSVTQLTSAITLAGLQKNNLLSGDGLPSSGVGALVNALQQQGKVSLVTQPQVLCQNNQVSQLRIVEQEGYLQSIQSTSLAGGAGTTGSAAVTSQITPGAVVTGLTLYVLPKILGNKIFLQVNADLSNNLGFQTISSNGQFVVQGQAQAGGNASAIQVPSIQQKQFNQRGIVASGDTLILAGFRQTNNRAGAQQLFSSQALGGRGAQESTTETLVLITPLILRGIA